MRGSHRVWRGGTRLSSLRVLQVNAEGALGEERCDPLSPLDAGDSDRVEVLIKAHCGEGAVVIEAIEVKVIDLVGRVVGGEVGVGGGGDIFLDTEPGQEAADKGCLPRAEVAKKTDDAPRFQFGGEVDPHLHGLLGGVAIGLQAID